MSKARVVNGARGKYCAAFIGFAAEVKPVQFETAGASALHTPSPLVLIQVTRGIGV